MILYIEYLKKYTHKKTELINEFSKVGGSKINTQKPAIFLYIRNKQSKNKKFLNNSICNSIKNNKNT